MKSGIWKKWMACFLTVLFMMQAVGCGKTMQESPVRAVLTMDEDMTITRPEGQDASEGDDSFYEDLFTSRHVYSQTIMIYMVGSDLESQYGNASADLREIQNAMPDTDMHNIVVYAGGTENWQLSSLTDGKDNLLELTEDGFEVIETTREKNMGKAETLSSFITYCLENYETDKYGLILWNHGAGPVLGFGVDENYKDLLTMEEIGEALEDSVGATDDKLEWIGFDACLMNSMEVADVLSPYANYMIASQETEPGWGWDYDFLSSLSEPDMDGARLGKVIIDSYIECGERIFEINERYYSDLTLSCIDLNRYNTAEEALNYFFEQTGNMLDVTTFPQMVRDRNEVRDFGTYSTNYNYSLVDVIQLLKQFSQDSPDMSEEAISAIERMVVYSRSNVEEAGGISICYPHGAEEDYTNYYIECQEENQFAPEYVNFLKSFYAIEDGEQIVSQWNVEEAETDVETVEVEEETSGGISDITLALTEEQQQNFADAYFLILCNAQASGYLSPEENERADEMYFYIHCGQDVVMDENGVLHAYYNNSVLYMKDNETNEYSAIPMILVEDESGNDEKRYFAHAVLSDFGDGDFSDWTWTGAKLQIVVDEENPNGVIRSVVPTEDEELGNPSRQLLDLDDYDLIEVVAGASYLTRDEDGKMMSFLDWEESTWIFGFDQDLTVDYSLEAIPLINPENYVCMFYIKDSQGNMTVSELIPLG